MSPPLRLLYAEDNPQDADLTLAHFRLTAPDLQLEILGTGELCQERLAKEPFDLLLLDNHLPDVDGTEILTRLRAEGHRLPIVMLTVVGDENSVARALLAGADDYVAKAGDYLTRLPALLRALVARVRDRPSEDGTQRARRVLYVEPNAADADLAIRHFAAFAPHLRLHIAENSSEALALLTSQAGFDLVMSDLRVSGTNAIEFFHEIQRREIDLPFIVITGHGDEQTAVALLRLGASDYIVKRDNYLSELPHSIDRALHSFQLDRTSRRLRADLESLNRTLEQRVVDRTAELLRESRQLSSSNRALKILSSCNEALIWAKDETSLLEQICRIAVQLGDYRLAWVGYAQEDPARSIIPMAQWGDETGYLAELTLTWAGDQPEGRGPTGQCIRGGEAVVCADLRDPACHVSSLEAAEKRGYRGLVCLPLRNADRTFGLLSLYSSEAREVGEAEVKLLKELAADLAFGIGTIRSRRVRERAEEALVSSLREKEALLKEVHHRVKNNLQVITSLLRLERRRVHHDITKSVLGAMQLRIQSMAILHETLYRSENFARVDLASYLSQVAHQLFRSLARQPATVRLNLDLAPVHLEIDQAIPCGLIVNELASNSLKHGFPDGRTGEVWIRLRPEGDTIRLSVADNGAGLPPDFDLKQQHSLGLQLVSDLAGQIQGRLELGPGPETSFEVTFVPTRAETAPTPGAP